MNTYVCSLIHMYIDYSMIYNYEIMIILYMGCIYTGWWLSPIPVKNISSSVGIIIPNIWKCLKPPTIVFIYIV